MSAVAARARRGAMAEAVSPHPLAEGLPAIFQPLLTDDEEVVLRQDAHGVPDADVAKAIGREATEIAALRLSAVAKLGLSADTSAAVLAARAARDTFVARLCAALDDVLAPVFVTLDSLDAYVDPALTPPDFLEWLGGWVSMTGRLGWPEGGWRAAIANAWWLYGRRGTADALRFVVGLYTEGDAEVDDPGGGDIRGGPDETRVSRPRKPPLVEVRVKGGRVKQGDTALLAGLEELVRLFVPAHLATRVEVPAR